MIGWAGLRGVVTLATAFLIPADVPFRATLIFAAMVVTAGTLLLQGLTLPFLGTRPGAPGAPDARSDALQAATVVTTSSNAALTHLDDILGPKDAPETVKLLRDRTLLPGLTPCGRNSAGPAMTRPPAEQYRRLRLQTIDIERDEVLKIRSSGHWSTTTSHRAGARLVRHRGVDADHRYRTVCAADRGGSQSQTPTPAAGPCGHLDRAPANLDPEWPRHLVVDCVREGTRTVHLRICLSCGNVGCCDFLGRAPRITALQPDTASGDAAASSPA